MKNKSFKLKFYLPRQGRKESSVKYLPNLKLSVGDDVIPETRHSGGLGYRNNNTDI